MAAQQDDKICGCAVNAAIRLPAVSSSPTRTCCPRLPHVGLNSECIFSPVKIGSPNKTEKSHVPTVSYAISVELSPQRQKPLLLAIQSLFDNQFSVRRGSYFDHHYLALIEIECKKIRAGPKAVFRARCRRNIVTWGDKHLTSLCQKSRDDASASMFCFSLCHTA